MKKLNLKRTVLVLFCLFTMCTWYNCNDDRSIELESKSDYIVENIDFNAFLQKQELKDFYNKVIDQGKILARNEDNIGLNKTLIKKVKTDKVESYTFLVDKKYQDKKKYENLVVTKNLENGEVTAVFLKYTMATELKLDENGNPYSFQGQLEIVPVNASNLDGLLSRSSLVCYDVQVLMCNDNRGDFTEDHEVTEACTSPDHVYISEYRECQTIVSFDAAPGGNGGGSNTTGGNSSLGGGGSSGANNTQTIVTSTIIPQFRDEFLKMASRLTTEQQNYLYSVNNYELRAEVADYYLENNSSIKAEEFIKEAIKALMNDDEVNFEDSYIKTKVSDDNYVYSGLKQAIPSVLTLSNGSRISVNFGTTRSDNKSANQHVSPVLIDALKFALENANNNLSSSNKITSIYVSATTNGKHSATSNHPSGLAIDISRINGKKMALTGVTNQIKELQKAFDSFQYIRENFGPFFKHKYDLNTGRWNLNHSVGGHKDHIHISVRK